MAKFLNPLTGLLEDDGAPVAPAPAAPAPVAPAPVKSAPVAPAPEPEAVVALEGPAQKKASESVTTSSTSRQTLPTTAEASLVKQREEADKKELALQERAAEAGRAKATEEAAQAAERAKLAADKEQKTQDVVAKGEASYQAAMAERQTQYESLKGLKITDYWENQSTGNKVLAGLSVMLGGIGGGMTGDKSNRALDIINKAIDVDLETQKANINKQLNVVNQADKGIDNAKAQQDYLLNNVNVVKEAAYASLAEKYAAMAKKRGVSDQDIVNDINYQGLVRKQNEAKLDYEKGLRKTVDASTQKQVTEALDPSASEKPTEAQGKARGFASRMVSATKNYDKTGGISPEGADNIRKHMVESYIESRDATGLAKWVLKPGSKPLPAGLSEKDRLAWAALEDFSRANLRKESGAAIGRDEFMDDLNQILPTRGDTPKLVQAKRRLMTQKLAATQQEVGRAKVNIPEEPQGPPAAGDIREGHRFKGGDPSNEKNWEVVQ